MKTRSTLSLPESNEGIFGWIWIIATMGSLYFLAMAIFAGGSWQSFAWTLGIVILAQWLAKGFQDNRRRLIFEAKLVREGYSPEQAGKEWLASWNSPE